MSKGKRSKPITPTPKSSAPPATEVQPALSLGKRTVFGIVAVVLTLVLGEGVLARIGVRPRLYDADPYVGFSKLLPLFVEDRGSDGRVYMVTAKNRLDFFNPQRFPKEKGAGVFRVFSMGGSTTYGHPYS